MPIEIRELIVDTQVDDAPAAPRQPTPATTPPTAEPGELASAIERWHRVVAVRTDRLRAD